MFNYQKICQELYQDLPERQKEVILRRFGLVPKEGLEKGKRETLESIGRSFGITRERVRQIEKDAFLKIKPKLAQYQKVFQYFRQELEKSGGVRKEEILLTNLGGKNQTAEVYFLLTLSGKFVRFSEDEDFYSFWALNLESLEFAKDILNTLSSQLRKIGHPLSFEELNSVAKRKDKKLVYYLEISKKIQQNSEGLYGLKEWPEINPRGVRDKAYLVFKKVGKPLHFKDVTKLIEGSFSQTVHNELIKDPRFVLVGRGVYALREWGYEPGKVKDIIAKILKENGPLTQSEIMERVLKQRLVKQSTILLNLSDRQHFLRDSQGKYKIKEA